jgi:putative ABC transport system permease protein
MLKIAWKNIWHKPLHAFLSLMLFSLGVGLVSFLLLFNHQVQQNFDKNLAQIDLVLGAKGSPLQLILCAMYHVDSPTGNIKLSEARPFLNPNHPLVAQAVPLSLGDNFQGYRIVGTTPSFPMLYAATIAEGRAATIPMEVVLGNRVAKESKLIIGSELSSSHGLVNDGLDHTHDEKYKVVGIYGQTGAVIDQLITTPLESIWQVHHSATEEAHEEEESEHEHEHDAANEDEREITAMLLKYRSKTNFQALNLPRNINENTNMQAAVPAFEMNRLYAMLGTGEKALKLLAWVIVLVSGLSIFIALFNGLKERRYELALLRVMGASRRKIWSLILIEALLLTLIGTCIGLLLSHAAMHVFSDYLKAAFHYAFTGFIWLREETWLFGAALLIGLLAGILPAWIAYRSDISKTLGKG